MKNFNISLLSRDMKRLKNIAQRALALLTIQDMCGEKEREW